MIFEDKKEINTRIDDIEKERIKDRNILLIRESIREYLKCLGEGSMRFTVNDLKILLTLEQDLISRDLTQGNVNIFVQDEIINE